MQRNMINYLNSNFKFFIKLLISCSLVFFLAKKIDWSSFVNAIYGIQLTYYITALILVLLSTCFMAAKYTLLIQGSSIHHSFWALIKINIVSRFYSLFLPPALGPELVRWYKITKNQSGKVFFMAASLFERVGFILISLLTGAFFLYFSPSSSRIEALQEKLLPLLLLLIFMMLVLHIFFLSKKIHAFGHRILLALIPELAIKDRLLEIYDTFFLYNRSTRLLIGLTSLSIGWHIFFLVRNYLLFVALSLPLSFLDVAWMTSLVFLLQILPVSMAGIGLREGAFAYMFAQIGLQPEQGVAVGLLFFSQFLLLGGIGGLLELLDIRRNRQV